MRSILTALVALFLASPAQAHFTITSPGAGQVYSAGDVVEVSISITVHHDPGENFDVALSEGGGGAFVDLVTGLDDTEFPWSFVLPDYAIPDAVLRIVQNGPAGYQFIRTASFVVAGAQPEPPAADVVDVPSADTVDPPPADAGDREIIAADDVPSAEDLGGPPDVGFGVETDAGALPTPATVAELRTLFATGCASNGCHGAPTPAAELDFSDSAFPAQLVGVPATRSDGDRVVPCEPNRSVLLQRLLGLGLLRMPPVPDAPRSAAEIEAIRQWIANGAVAEGSLSTPHPERCPSPPGPDAPGALPGDTRGSVADVSAAPSDGGSGGCAATHTAIPGLPGALLLLLFFAGWRRRLAQPLRVR